MIRPGGIKKQVASLFGLAACFHLFLVLSGCSVFYPGTRPAGADDERLSASWVDTPPSGCAVGSSGPTLNPGDSIRYARLSAIESLASGSLDIDVQSVTGTSSEGSFEVSAQALSGTLENARIVALWADTRSDATVRSRVRQVYALACWPDAKLAGLERPAFPEWLIAPASEDERICAVGVAGPTWKSEDQAQGALRDARAALSVALESRIEKRIFDDGQGVAKIAREVEPSALALSRAATAGELDRDWLDEEGTGPVGLPGVLYGLVCIED